MVRHTPTSVPIFSQIQSSYPDEGKPGTEEFSTATDGVDLFISPELYSIA